MGSDHRVVSCIKANDIWAPSKELHCGHWQLEVASPGFNQFSRCLTLTPSPCYAPRGSLFLESCRALTEPYYKIALGTPVVQGPTWLPLG